MNLIEIVAKVGTLALAYPWERHMKVRHTEAEVDYRALTGGLNTAPSVIESKECPVCGKAHENEIAISAPSLTPKDSTDLVRMEKEGDYCLSCIPPDTLIVGHHKTKAIGDFRDGDPVLGYTDDNTVTHTYRFRHTGPARKFKTAYCGIQTIITGDQPVLVIEPHKCNHLCRNICLPGHEYLGCNNKKTTYEAGYRSRKCVGQWYKQYKPHFVKANDLKVGMCTVLPIEKKLIDVNELDILTLINIKLNESDGFVTKANSHPVKKLIKVNDDFMTLAGYYLAEGYSNFPERGGVLNFSFGYTERDLADLTADLIYSCFGVTATIKPYQSSIIVQSCSEILATFFSEMFGTGAFNKHVPEWMLYLPVEKQKCLVDAFVDGDGCKTKTGYEMYSVSPTLIFQLRTMLMRRGIIAGLQKRIRNVGGFIDNRQIVGNYDGYNLRVCTAEKRKAHAGIDKDWMYLPITSVDDIQYDDDVMDLEVTPELVYQVPNAVLYDCVPSKHLMRSQDAMKDARSIFNSKKEFTDVAEEKIQNAVYELNAAEKDLEMARVPEELKPAVDEFNNQIRKLRNYLRQDQSGLEVCTVLPDKKDELKQALDTAYDINGILIKYGYDLAKVQLQQRARASLEKET
jgi:hypothetical protein